MSEQTPWDNGAPGVPPAPPVPPMPDHGHHRARGGIGVGVVLVAIGLLLLVGQFVPGISWWQTWPLLLVLIGGIVVVTPDSREGWGLSRVLDGIGTVILGLILLGNTTGYISWGVWWTVLTLWPVLLVALGISIIGRAVGQSWVRAISTLVIWAALGYAVAISLTGAGGLMPLAPITATEQGTPFSYSEPLGGVQTADLTLDGGVGDIGIGSSSGNLVTASGRSPFGTPTFSVARSGDTAHVNVGLGEAHGHVGPAFVGGHMDVGLSDSVLWNATINVGASNLTADLSQLQLSGLTVKTGVSSSDIKLGRLAAQAPQPKVIVKAGVSSVSLGIPKGVPVRVTTDNGLTSLSVSDDFKQVTTGVYVSPGYAQGSGYDIDVESGVGSVSIRTY